MKRIRVDAEKCAGCRLCEMVCSFRHTGRFSPTLSRVSVLKDDKHGLDYPLICRQCEHCPPVDVCPSDALSQLEDGTVKVDADACNECGLCPNNCRFGAIKLVESRPIVCDLCKGEPYCVKRCPTGALAFTDIDGDDESPKGAFEKLLRRCGIAA